MVEPLHARVAAQLKLALLCDCGCHETLNRLEHEARRSGLTGAEIDAALAGRSFEARTAAAVTFACALKSGDAGQLERARLRAVQFGISDLELNAIAGKVRQILATHKP